MAAASLLQLESVVDCFHDTNPLLFGRSDLRVGLSSVTPKMMICSDNDRNKQFNNNEDGKNNKDDNDLISNGAVLPHPVTNIYSPRPRKKIPDRRRVLRDTSWLCAWMSCFSGHLQNAKAATTTTLSVPIAAFWNLNVSNIDSFLFLVKWHSALNLPGALYFIPRTQVIWPTMATDKACFTLTAILSASMTFAKWNDFERLFS